MSEDKELLARISQLAGKNLSQPTASKLSLTVEGHINLHKHQAPTQHENHAGSIPTNPRSGSTQDRRSARAAPYPYTRGHTGKIIRNPHRNRTLILNNGKSQDRGFNSLALQDSHSTSNEVNDGHNATGWVSKRDRHMQLFNSAIYNKESQIRTKAIEQTRKKDQDRKDQDEKRKINKHLQKLTTPAGRSSAGLVTTAPIDHQLYVNGIRFRVVNGGSKLSRIFGRKITDSPALRLTRLRWF